MPFSRLKFFGTLMIWLPIQAKSSKLDFWGKLYISMSTFIFFIFLHVIWIKMNTEMTLTMVKMDNNCNIQLTENSIQYARYTVCWLDIIHTYKIYTYIYICMIMLHVKLSELESSQMMNQERDIKIQTSPSSFQE